MRGSNTADLAIFLNKKHSFDKISISYLLITSKNGITFRENRANLIMLIYATKRNDEKFVKKTGKSDETL